VKYVPNHLSQDPTLVDAFANALLLFISPDETELLNCLWNLELSQVLYPLLEAFEIAGRNTIDETIADQRQNDRWLRDSAFFPRNSST
jgi:hypothetical protein